MRDAGQESISCAVKYCEPISPSLNQHVTSTHLLIHICYGGSTTDNDILLPSTRSEVRSPATTVTSWRGARCENYCVFRLRYTLILITNLLSKSMLCLSGETVTLFWRRPWNFSKAIGIFFFFFSSRPLRTRMIIYQSSLIENLPLVCLNANAGHPTSRVS